MKKERLPNLEQIAIIDVVDFAVDLSASQRKIFTNFGNVVLHCYSSKSLMSVSGGRLPNSDATCVANSSAVMLGAGALGDISAKSLRTSISRSRRRSTSSIALRRSLVSRLIVIGSK